MKIDKWHVSFTPYVQYKFNLDPIMVRNTLNEDRTTFSPHQLPLKIFSSLFISRSLHTFSTHIPSFVEIGQ